MSAPLFRLLVLLALPVLVGCGVTSGTFIQPGQAFLLGGGQAGGFQTEIRNSGPAAVSLLEERASGETVALGRLGVGDRRAVKAQPGSRLVFRNEGRLTTLLHLQITGDTNLGMGYQESAETLPMQYQDLR